MARSRQAVVVIHGIGEQRPMNTLRGFVKSLMKDFEITNQKALFYNKPDLLSESFELRMLSVYPSKGRARTDFFEYYWAYNMRGTKLGHVLSWLWNMLFRTPSNVPDRIKWLYYTFWSLTIAFIILIGTGLIKPAFFTAYKQYTIIAAIVYVVVSAINLVTLRYLGDAARYTDASPENIQERETIRANGIRLVKAIHDSKKYDRVIIVGHSLGTIIGYDIINHLFCRYNSTFSTNSHITSQPVLNKFEDAHGNGTPWDEDKSFNLPEYQKDQASLLSEEIALGNPWKISDFITLGSPLTYASILMANDKNELRERQNERELSVSPPIVESENNFSYPVSRKGDNEQVFTRRVLHHAAPFACTRWHNAFYANDFVGGKLQPVFGKGIAEHKMKFSGLAGVIPFLSHTRYWGDNKAEQASVEWLRKIIIPDYQRKTPTT